jgi:hypothetical protein
MKEGYLNTHLSFAKAAKYDSMLNSKFNTLLKIDNKFGFELRGEDNIFMAISEHQVIKSINPLKIEKSDKYMPLLKKFLEENNIEFSEEFDGPFDFIAVYDYKKLIKLKI